MSDERMKRLAAECAGHVAAELNAECDEPTTQWIAEIIASALAVSYADGRADDPAIARERRRADEAIAAAEASAAALRAACIHARRALDLVHDEDRLREHLDAALGGDAGSALLSKLAAAREALRTSIYRIEDVLETAEIDDGIVGVAALTRLDEHYDIVLLPIRSSVIAAAAGAALLAPPASPASDAAGAPDELAGDIPF